MDRWFGAIARNQQGRLGIIIGYEYADSERRTLKNFYGIGLRGGRWKSTNKPEWIASCIQDYVNRRYEIESQSKNKSGR